MGSKVQQYEATKHPDSNLDYGRNWGDVTHMETYILVTTVTDIQGTVTKTETLEEKEVIDHKGWLREGEIIIESEWSITSAKEKVPTLVPSDLGSGITQQGTVTLIFLKGGTAGVQYELANHIKAYDTNNSTFREETKIGVINCCRT